MITDELRRFAEVALAITDNHTGVEDGLRQAILTCFQLVWQGLPNEARCAVTKFQGSPDTEQSPRTRPPSRPVKRKADRFTAPTSSENDQPCSTAHNRPVVEAHAEVKPPERGLAESRFIDTPKKKRRIDTNSSNFPPEEDINRWIQSPKDFFIDTGLESEGISRISVRFTSILSLKSVMARLQTASIQKKLGEDAASVRDSTFRAWVKEGYVYFLLGREFGLHTLFLDVLNRREAQRMNLSPNVDSKSESDIQQQYKEDTEKCLSNLEFVDIGFPKETSPLFKSAAEAISKHLEQAQIDAGILKVSTQLDCQNGSSSEGTVRHRTVRLHSPSEESPEPPVDIQSRDASVDDNAVQQQDQTKMPIPQDDTDVADLSSLQSPTPRVLEHGNHGQASSQSPSQESAAHPTPDRSMIRHSATISPSSFSAPPSCPEGPLYERSSLPPSNDGPNGTLEDRNPGTMSNSIDQHHLSHCSFASLKLPQIVLQEGKGQQLGSPRSDLQDQNQDVVSGVEQGNSMAGTQFDYGQGIPFSADYMLDDPSFYELFVSTDELFDGIRYVRYDFSK
ncbi:hypothetical protein Forpi1262_v015281 [Fusarium oxysporum f. sp. raphani]|uniref:Uncharacterized protein n=1 Tax=Fusarium oxysporum f. sp. raphani TaxID=96318 RepID=A0A8J5UJA1_FUSOX|nr:hypothetical protein Forpi1262_v015281 [Fusarium oxysporum f. sp. raphani]